MKVQIKLERMSDCVNVYRDGKLRGSVLRRRVNGKWVWVVLQAGYSTTFDYPGAEDYAERRDTWTLRGAILRIARLPVHEGRVFRTVVTLYAVQVNGMWYYVNPDSDEVLVNFQTPNETCQAIARRALVLARVAARNGDAQ